MPEIDIVENIMDANDQIAARVRQQLDAAGVLGLNLMASPGAGKTSVLTATVNALKDDLRLAALDGDVHPVDVEKIAKTGIPVELINTGGDCHLTPTS
jgi:hydrogenase nickel incorporation protein HypB